MLSIFTMLMISLALAAGETPTEIAAADNDSARPKASMPFAVILSAEALPLGAENERELAVKVAEKSDSLIAAAQDHEQKDQLRQAFDGYLAAANWILAYQIEPMATRELLQAAQPSDADAALVLVNRARAQLARAATIWKSIENDEKQVDSGDRFRLADQLESLQGFANAFWALWRTDYASDSQRDETLAQAAGRLSIAREDDRPHVALAAQLWQAYLYFVRGRSERTIDLLPDAMTEPDQAVHYEYFSRILRCRALVRETQGFSSAIALLARLEHSASEWFDEPAARLEAQRVAGLARRQVLNNWAAQFRKSSEPDRAKWCDEAIADIDRKHFSTPESAPLLRLETAAPRITDIPFQSPQPAPQDTPGDAEVETPQIPESEGE